MGDIRESLVHRLDISLDKESNTFSLLEDGNKVFGPIPLVEAGELVVLLGILIGDANQVLTRGQVEESEGKFRGVLKQKAGWGDNFTTPHLYLHHAGEGLTHGSCYFTGSMYELLDLVQGVVK